VACRLWAAPIFFERASLEQVDFLGEQCEAKRVVAVGEIA